MQSPSPTQGDGNSVDGGDGQAGPTEFRKPSHSSPNSNSSALSDPFVDNCSISPLEPHPSSQRVSFAPTVVHPPRVRGPETSKNKWLPNFTTRQWLIFIIFVGTNFLAGMVYNMKGPFYPKEAESKGVSPSSFGFVFGIFEFTKGENLENSQTSYH